MTINPLFYLACLMKLHLGMCDENVVFKADTIKGIYSAQCTLLQPSKHFFDSTENKDNHCEI